MFVCINQIVLQDNPERHLELRSQLRLPWVQRFFSLLGEKEEKLKNLCDHDNCCDKLETKAVQCGRQEVFNSFV